METYREVSRYMLIAIVSIILILGVCVYAYLLLCKIDRNVSTHMLESEKILADVKQAANTAKEN